MKALACRLGAAQQSKFAPLRNGTNMTGKGLVLRLFCREAALGQGTASVAQLAEEVRVVSLLSWYVITTAHLPTVSAAPRAPADKHVHHRLPPRWRASQRSDSKSCTR